MLERQAPQAIWTRRAGIMTVARLVAGAVAIVPSMSYVNGQQARVNEAASKAKAAIPDPAPPVASADLVDVARATNNLYGQSQAIQNEPRHIPWSEKNTDLIKALDDDKTRRVAEVDERILVLQSSPEYQRVIADHAREKTNYREQILEVAKARSEEAARLENEAGVSWLSKAVAPISMLSLLLPFLSTYIPIIAGRPSFPLRDTYVEPPQTESNTSEVFKLKG